MSEIESAFEIICKGFNKELASRLRRKLIIEYYIQGEKGGIWSIIIHNGNLQIIKENAGDPDIKLRFNNGNCLLRYYRKEFSELEGFNSGCLFLSGSLTLLYHYHRIIGFKS